MGRWFVSLKTRIKKRGGQLSMTCEIYRLVRALGNRSDCWSLQRDYGRESARAQAVCEKQSPWKEAFLRRGYRFVKSGYQGCFECDRYCTALCLNAEAYLHTLTGPLERHISELGTLLLHFAPLQVRLMREFNGG